MPEVARRYVGDARGVSRNDKILGVGGNSEIPRVLRLPGRYAGDASQMPRRCVGDLVWVPGRGGL